MTLGRRTIQSDANALRPYLGSKVGDAFAMFQALPQLRGFWPMSSIDDGFDAFDLSAQGRTLTATSLTAASFTTKNIMPYCVYDGSADFHSRADESGLDITGSLTMGCWYSPTTTPSGSSEYILTKNGAVTQFAYQLRRVQTTGYIKVEISADGTATTAAATNTSTIPVAGVWSWVVFRFDSASTLSVTVNTDKASVATAATTIFNSTASFAIGCTDPDGGGTNLMPGSVSMAFLCAAALSDSHIAELYNSTKGLFK